MVRLLDVRDGSSAEVRPARPGVLRVCAHVPQATGPADITWLRVCLVADLLFRTAELRDMQVLTVLAFDAQSAAQQQAAKHAADALGIHPPVAHTDLTQAHDGPIDVHVTSQGIGPDSGWRGLITPVGTATQAADTADPLAIRFALMSVPYHQPADLTADLLADADETVARWRRYVAQWAESPSQAMPARISELARAAFDDSDTVTALGLLRDLIQDAEVPAGAKFETFVYADRVLGLDLPRDIGR
jgi:hypothetical protein